MGVRRSEEKNFPLLRASLRDFKDGEMQIRDPLLFGERERLKRFVCLVLSSPSIPKRKRILARVLREILGAKKTTSEIYNELNKSLEEAHQFVRWIFRTYLPCRFEGIVNSDGLIAEESDFISLLKKYRDLEESTDSLALIRKFEARRTILLTLILFDLKIHRQRLQLNGASIQAVTRYLEKRFFTSEALERKTVVSYHDPADCSRVVFWHFKDAKPSDAPVEERFVVREIEFACRKFRWQGREHFVYFVSRDKTPFSHLLKMLRKDIRDPHASALDWRGFKLVFFSEEAFEDGVAKLREDVFYLPGMTWKLEDGRFFRESENPHTSKNFRAKKFVTVHGGQPVEVIVEMIVNHLNGFFSCGDENHELYRTRQLISTALPLIFPRELYGVDWNNVEVQKEIYNVVKGRF